MKNIIYLFLLLLFVGCKEEELQPNINFDSPYVITDEPDHPVNHKRYLLYKEYGVPIYFTDTVKSVYITKNIHGDSVFAYEKLDLNWGFTSMASIDHKLQFIKNEADQLKALANVEEYLKIAVESLKPFSILLVDNFSVEGNTDVLSIDDSSAPFPRNKVNSLTTYRTLVMSQTHKTFSSGFWNKLSLTLLKNQIQKTIVGEAYKTKLINFQSITTSTNYDKWWREIGYPQSEFNPITWRNFNPLATYTPAQSAAFEKIRVVFGKFGFIGHSTTYGQLSSPTIVMDRNQYIDALMGYNQATFERLWGQSPLVMEKYSILKDIIVNDIKVPIDEIVK